MNMFVLGPSCALTPLSGLSSISHNDYSKIAFFWLTKVLAVTMVCLASCLLIVALCATFASAYNNGVGMRPVMGWNTWCTMGPCSNDVCTETEVKEVATAMLSNGMFAAGYTYINLDDCWAALDRDAKDHIIPDPERFPSGIPALVDWLHEKGFKFGLYTSAGNVTCNPGGRSRKPPGSYDHYQEDAATFASWKVDYVKIDWCGGNLINSQLQHTEFSIALNLTGRPMFLELCRGYWHPAPPYVAQVANSWRVGGDVHDNWKTVASTIEQAAWESTYSGAFNWAYNDFLMIGGQGCDAKSFNHCPGMTDAEYRTAFTLWSLTASPLIVATDVRNMTSIMKEVLLNQEAIDVNQDYTMPTGKRIGFEQCDWAVLGACQTWARQLSDGTVAVALLNMGSSPHPMVLNFTAVNNQWTAQTKVAIRDLWAHAEVGVFQGFYMTPLPIESHAARYLRLRVSTN